MKKCDKCGPVGEDLTVIKFNDVSRICENCIIKMFEIIDKKYYPAPSNPSSNQGWLSPIPSIQGIISHLNKSIVGQQHAKEIISIAVRNHYKRMHLAPEERYSVDKTNILLMGNSGTGKTQMVKSLATYLDIPVLIVDTSSYTSAGYVGNDVDEIIKDLYEKSGQSIEKAERGIIFLDEIDKKKKTLSGGRTEPGGEQAQQAFLKLVEGKEVKVKGGIIDTSNILFIAAGAFVGIDTIITERVEKKGIGFSNSKTQANDSSTIYGKVNTEDLIKYGMIPELIGRFPVMTFTNDLTKEDIKDIIRKPENSILNQFKKLFSIEDGLELEITVSAIDYMSDMVLRDKIGVRGVRKVFEEVLKDIQVNAEMIKKNGGHKIQINKSVFINNELPTIYNQEGKKMQIGKNIKRI